MEAIGGGWGVWVGLAVLVLGAALAWGMLQARKREKAPNAAELDRAEDRATERQYDRPGPS